MIRQWVMYNKLEDFNSLLNYTDEDLIPHGVGNLSFYKENDDSVVKIMSPTPLQELINFRWYIQHLIHESGYLYDDDESNYPLSEDKWMLQTHGKLMKYVFYTLHKMTPEQMKMNPLNSKSDKVRQTDCRAEIELGMCVESHLDKPLDSERDFTMWNGSQKEICHIYGYG